MTSTMLVSIASLAVIIALAVAGLWCTHYRDNTLQRAGLALLSVAAVALISRALRWGVDPLDAVLHLGLACLGLGTALKVWQHRPRRTHSHTEGERPCA